MRRTAPLPEDCPNPSVHGNPFRYCPYCTWTEPSEDRPKCPSCGQDLP